jgi:glutamyl-tRNA reductase
MAASPAAVGGVRRFVDISVPRNIDPAINELREAAAGAAIVYNVDDLKEVVAGNKEARAAAAAEAEILLKEEQRSFEAWRDSLETVPTIKALRTMAEGIRAAEFEKAIGRFGEGATKKQMKVRGRLVAAWRGRADWSGGRAGGRFVGSARPTCTPSTPHRAPLSLIHPHPPPQAIEELSKAIVNKLLHGPMTALRCDGTDPDAVSATLANMDALERMFELSQVQRQAPPQPQQPQPQQPAAAGK